MRLSRDLFPKIDGMRERQRQHHPEIEDETFWEFYEASKDYSLVHVAGFYNVFQSMTYLARNSIAGCAIESGCFLGGIAIFMGLMRRRLQLDMPIVLLDTFCGPPVGTADTFLGRVTLESWQGERPMQIVWRLAHPMPGAVYTHATLAAG